MRYIIRPDSNGQYLHSGQRVSVQEIADSAKIQAPPSVVIFTAADLAAFKTAQGITDAVPAKPTPKPPVPQTVTPLQMRLALNELGLRVTVEKAVASTDQSTRDAWDYALEIRRDNALLDSLAKALGKSSEDLDNIFRLAAKK